MTKISIIIPVLNGYEMTKNIIKNINDVFVHPYEIIIIDDFSDDRTKELKNDKRVRYYRNEEWLWVNKSWNKWISKAKGDYILVINNDIVIKPWFDTAMVECLEDSYIVWPYSTRLDKPFEWEVFIKQQNIIGWCWMTTKERRKEIGDIDESLIIWYGDDWIFQRVTKDLWQTCWIADTLIHHFESKTLTNDEHKQKIRKEIEKDKIRWQEIVRERGWN